MAVDLDLVDAVFHELALGVVDVESDLYALLEVEVVGHHHVETQFAVLPRCVWFEHDVEVADGKAPLREEVAVLELLGLGLEDVLLQLGRAALAYTYHQLVDPLLKIWREHEVGRRIGILHLGHGLVVYEERVGHAHILQMEEYVVVVHGGVNRDLLHETGLAARDGYALGREGSVVGRLGAFVRHGILAFVVCDELRAVDARALRCGGYDRKQGCRRKNKPSHNGSMFCRGCGASFEAASPDCKGTFFLTKSKLLPTFVD